ncbi:cytochrome o ubiquinol oxidase subunit IV [Pokkaliibacter sp. MBI-7]|uniref:Cytochrome bo(3) ubiquinol oxidase subunit 4 n=1 Tax=Proteobacteria bacterium 228 TaxID=2083153 RepID=A0A2S5KLK3_9PROT|nr:MULTISPECIES: cytochrome o ubiquinol oxidase subunit IV [Pokkaliibacter]MDH2436378.1 cytochrome o ubiquinol oxidase subunit IV [Pokkaliibacter sp. MBI-7]PPC75525.1 cytochrome o ubiquinol oxidase subunit IV [Pokkaliibacter plantistimulans]
MSDHHSHGSGGASHGSMKSYVSGFILSIILTLVPFALVMFPGLATPVTAVIVMVIMAIAQVLVQLVFFLHMDSSSEQSWNVMAFAFTILIAVILIGGSVWIMYNMHINMVL